MRNSFFESRFEGHISYSLMKRFPVTFSCVYFVNLFIIIFSYYFRHFVRDRDVILCCKTNVAQLFRKDQHNETKKKMKNETVKMEYVYVIKVNNDFRNGAPKAPVHKHNQCA